MSDPQRLYKKRFQSLIRRVKGILLKSLQKCNQILTHNLILSQIDSKFSWTPSKILRFRSSHIAHKVAEVTTFQRIFPFFCRRKPCPNDNRCQADLGSTHSLSNSCKILNQKRMVKSQVRKRWSTDSFSFLHITHHPGDKEWYGRLFWMLVWTLILSKTSSQRKTLTLLEILNFQIDLAG